MVAVVVDQSNFQIRNDYKRFVFLAKRFYMYKANYLWENYIFEVYMSWSHHVCEKQQGVTLLSGGDCTCLPMHKNV